MHRRNPGTKPHPGRRRGEQSFRHSPRLNFSPRPYGRDEVHQRAGHSAGRHGHHYGHHQQYNGSSAQYVPDLRDRDAASSRNPLARVHPPLDDSAGYMDQSSSLPQLSSNPAAAALEASLLLLTELATNLNPGIPRYENLQDPYQHSAVDGYDADAHGGPIPGLVDVHLPKSNQESGLHDTTPNYRDGPVNDNVCGSDDRFTDPRRLSHIHNQGTRSSPNPVHVEDLYEQEGQDNRHPRRLAHSSDHSSGRHGNSGDNRIGGGMAGRQGDMGHTSRAVGRHDGGFEAVYNRRDGRGAHGPRHGMIHDGQARLNHSSRSSDNGQGIIHIKDGVSSSIQAERLWHGLGTRLDIANGDDLCGMANSDGEYDVKHESDGWYNQSLGFNESSKIECDNFLHINNRLDSELNHPTVRHSFDSHSWDSQQRPPLDDKRLTRPGSSKNIKGNTQPRPIVYDKSQSRATFGGSTSPIPASSNSQLDGHGLSTRSSPHPFQPGVGPDFDEHPLHIRKRVHDTSVSPTTKKQCKSSLHRQSEAYKGSSHSKPHPSPSFRSRLKPPAKLDVQKRLGPQPEEDSGRMNLQGRLGPDVSDGGNLADLRQQLNMQAESSSADRGKLADLRQQLNKQAESSSADRGNLADLRQQLIKQAGSSKDAGRSVQQMLISSDKHLSLEQGLSTVNPDCMHRAPSTRGFPSDSDLLQSLVESKLSLGFRKGDVTSGCDKQLHASFYDVLASANKLLITKGIPVDRPFPSQHLVINTSSANPDIFTTPSIKCDGDSPQQLASGGVLPDSDPRKGISSDGHSTHSSTLGDLSPCNSQNTGISPKSASSLFPNADQGSSVSHDSKTLAPVVKEMEPTLLDVDVLAKEKSETDGASFNLKQEETLQKGPIALKEVSKAMMRFVSEVKTDSGKFTATSVAVESNNLVRESKTLSSSPHVDKPFCQPRVEVKLDEASVSSSNSAGVHRRPPLPNQSSTGSLPDLHLDNCSLGQLSDSDNSECGLVIDLNHVPDSPCMQRSDASSSEPSLKAMQIAERESEKTRLHGDICVSIANKELGSVLVNELLKCRPSPLHGLYYSMEIVINTINQGKASASAVLQAFRFYAVSTAMPPFSLQRLYRTELVSLNEKCVHEIEKWKVQVQVFCLLSSTLSERKDLKAAIATEVSKEHVSAESEVDLESLCVMHYSKEHQAPQHEVDVMSVLSCGLGVEKPTGKVSEDLSGVQQSKQYSKQDISSTELGLDVSLERYMTASDASEGGECSMSVCSTVSDEHPCSSQPVSPVMVNLPRSGNERRMDHKGVPLRDENECRRRDRSVSLSSGELTPSPPPTFTVVNKHMVAKHNDPSKAQPLIRTTESNPTWPLVRTTKANTTRPLARSGGGRTTRPLHHSASYSRDPGSVRSQTGAKHTVCRSTYNRKWSGSGERYSARSRSPVTQFQRSRSPKSVRPRKSRSRSPRGHDPRRTHSGNKTHDRQQRVSLTRELEDEEDMELLQLKKEVILSIVQKPDTGKAGTKVVASGFKKSRSSVNPKGDNQSKVTVSLKSKSPLGSGGEVKRQKASISASSNSHSLGSGGEVKRQKASISASSNSHSDDVKSPQAIPECDSTHRSSCQQKESSKPASASISTVLKSQKVKSSLTKKPKISQSKSQIRSSETASPVVPQAKSQDPLPNTNLTTLNHLRVQSFLARKSKSSRSASQIGSSGPVVPQAESQDPSSNTSLTVSNCQKVKPSLTRRPKSSPRSSQIGSSGPSSPVVPQAESQDPSSNTSLTVSNCQKVKPSLTRRPKSSPRSSQIGSSGPSSPVVPQAESQDPSSNIKSQEGSERPVSVMVFPGKESTWKIQSFQITSSGCDSDSEMGDEDLPDAGAPNLVINISEISSYLAEARKVASQSSTKTVDALAIESIDLPIPPASLPPAQQKEYIILKQKIALHERKKKRLSNNPSRSSSPHSLSRAQTAPLPVAIKPGHSDSKAPSPPLASRSVEDTVSSESSVVEKPTEKQHVTEEYLKELEECMSKLEHHKSLEEQEQSTITQLTNQLTECVSEVESHECNMDTIQKQLASLQKKLEKAGEALNRCEQKMNDLRNNVRSAQQRKAKCSNTIMMCESQISALKKRYHNKDEVEFESIFDSEVIASVKIAEVSARPSDLQAADVPMDAGDLQAADVPLDAGDLQAADVPLDAGDLQAADVPLDAGDLQAADVPLDAGDLQAADVPMDAGDLQAADVPLDAGDLQVADVLLDAGDLQAADVPLDAGDLQAADVPLDAGDLQAADVPLDAGDLQAADVPLDAGDLQAADVPLDAGDLQAADVPLDASDLQAADVPLDAGDLQAADVPLDASDLQAADVPLDESDLQAADVPMDAGDLQVADVPLDAGDLQAADVPLDAGDLQAADVPLDAGDLQAADVPLDASDLQAADESLCMDVPLSSFIKHVLPRHILEVEPISDAEDMGMEEGAIVQCQQAYPGVVQVDSNGGQGLDRVNGQNATDSSLLLLMNMETGLYACQEDDKYLESYTGPPDVLKEVVIQSSGALACRRTLPYDRPTKLDKMLNVVMHNALKFPCVEDGSQQPALYNLSMEGDNVQPLLNSVMSSLTQQSFNEVLSNVQAPSRCSAMGHSSAEGSDDWYTTASNLDSCFHTCTEDPFTLSHDDPPMLILPMVVDGDVDLEVQILSISTVAMDTVYDGIVVSPASLEGNVGAKAIVLDDVHGSGCSTSIGGNLEDIGCDSEVFSPESFETSSDTNVVGTEKKHTLDSQARGGQVCHPSKLGLKPDEYVQIKVEPSIALVHSKLKSVPKSTRDSPQSKGKLSSQKSTNPMKVAGVGSVAESQSKVVSSQSVAPSSAEAKSKPVSNGKSKPASALANKLASGPSIRLTKPSQVESHAKPVASLAEGKLKVIGSSVEIEVLSGGGLAAEGMLKSAIGLPDSMSASSRPSATSANVHYEPDEIRTILHRYIAHKSQLSAKAGVQKVDITETCARTSGLRATLPAIKAQRSAVSVDEGSSMAESFAKKIILNCDVASLASRAGFLDGPEGLGVPLNFSVNELLSANCVITNPSLLPPTVELTQSVLKSLEDPPLSNSIQSLPVPEGGGYKPYHSSLLMFSSYRLSSHFSSSAKAPLSSITFSNKLDPNHIMCRFELTGVCSDSSCTAQHLRDLQMTKKELVQDLMAYCPTLAGCTERELADAGTTQARTADSVCSKLSSFSSKFLKRYVDKVSDEELWKLVVYETNTERMKTRLKREVISFEDRPWTASQTSSAASSSGRSLERSSIPLQSQPVDRRKRYFNVEVNVSTKPSSSSETVSNFVSSALKLVAESNLQQALVTLEEGLKVRQDSEEMWLACLQLKSEVTSDSDLQSLYDLFSKAVASTQSYVVVLETVRLARCYKSKLKALNAGLALTRSLSPSDTASRYSFELFINLILLDLQSGRFSVALKHFDQARRPVDQELTATMNTNKFAGLFGVLERQECILMCLCHLTLVYSGSLPVSLFTGNSYHMIPAKLASYQFFAVPFNSSVNLSPNSYKKILRLFKFYLDQLHEPTLPNSQTVERILPLFRNVILFETMHGSHQKAINILVKLTLLCPGLPDLWMMLARIKELDGIDGCVTLEEAICISPMNPELYYLAARLELSRMDKVKPDPSTGTTDSCGRPCAGPSHCVGETVEWLSRCVRAFYKTDSAETLSAAQVLTLYRKLLNQMIGYQPAVPTLAEGVDPRNLKEAQCPLWMCYCHQSKEEAVLLFETSLELDPVLHCVWTETWSLLLNGSLLVELTIVPSTSMSGGELFHQGAEDAYESAVHAVHSPEAHKTLWREYIYYMRSKVAAGNQEDFQRFLDCVHRCLIDVECSSSTSGGRSASQSTPGSYTDYSFHNEMVRVVTSCLPPASAFKFTVLRNFARRFPRNTTLLTELVQCALLQKPPNVDFSQITLAEFLALYPQQSPKLWKQAIVVELELGHVKEARWMFNKALLALPLHVDLWRDFLLFELKELVADSASSSSDLKYQRVMALVERARPFGIDLVLVLRDLAAITAAPTTS